MRFIQWGEFDETRTIKREDHADYNDAIACARHWMRDADDYLMEEAL